MHRTIRIALATLAIVAPGSADVLPLVNPGFELVSRPLAPGELTNGAGGLGVPVGTRLSLYGVPQYQNTVVIPGWRTVLPTANPFTVEAGIMNPAFSQQGAPFLTGYEGVNVATVRHFWMQQTLPVFVRARTRYRLHYLAGHGLWEPGESVFVALLASPDLATLAFPGVPTVTTLAISNIIPVPGAAGQMRPYHFEFTTPHQLPANMVHRYLAVAIVGGDGITLMNFDDFRLESTRPIPVPPPVPKP